MNILLGVTGSVAATLVPVLIDALRAALPQPIAKASIRIVATEKSLHFFDPANVPVLTDSQEWNSWKRKGDPVLHIDVRKWADVLVVAPLDANTLAKMAGGICDNLLTCVMRAWDFDKWVVLCPAMNTFMWHHPLTAEHLAKVSAFGKVMVIPPTTKTLACGDTGMGALESPLEIAKRVEALVISAAEHMVG